MRRLVWAAMGVALISMVFAGCKKETTYTVRVSAAEGGTVEGQNGEYKEGETVVFTAVPADGYYFSHWSDYQDDNPRTIIVSTSNISITAKFIGVSPKDGGTVETRGSGYRRTMDGVESYLAFDITAIPTNGYCFSQWSDGNTYNPRQIEVDETVLTAEFVPQTIVTVDLGLTSGNLWATCNIGTINPWNYGNYYAWGETQTKDYYGWENYKYCNGDEISLTKYNYDAEYGTVDNKKTLEPTDDVATVVFGAEYSIPTLADWNELLSECYWVWTRKYNNHSASGYIVYRAKNSADKGVIVYEDDIPSASYSLSDAHIFLPAAGYRHTRLEYEKSYGCYMSTSVNSTYYPAGALEFYFQSSGIYPESNNSRCTGQSVRPVKRP